MTAASEGLGSVINYKGNVMQQLTYSNELNRITKQNIVAKKSNYGLNALYDTFEPAGEIVFPRKINISVSGNRRTFNADFTINRVTFNENVQLQPIDRSRFTKTSIDQLLKKNQLAIIRTLFFGRDVFHIVGVCYELLLQ
jgi:hypothetical protein